MTRKTRTFLYCCCRRFYRYAERALNGNDTIVFDAHIYTERRRRVAGIAAAVHASRSFRLHIADDLLAQRVRRHRDEHPLTGSLQYGIRSTIFVVLPTPAGASMQVRSGPFKS